MSSQPKARLHGWKEIATYVARDIRTVERWEKQRGLPVRRVPGAGRSAVYVDVASLEQWLAASSGSAATVQDTPAETPDITAPTAPDPEPPGFTQPTVMASPHRFPARWYLPAAALLLLAGAAWPVILHFRARASARALTEPVKPVLLSSRVPGVDDLCLRGAYLLEQRAPTELNNAREDFTRATVLDPEFAPAFSGLAQTYNLLREYGQMPDAEAYAKARAAAERAIALAPALPEPHVSLGFADFFGLLKPAEAEQEFKTAIQLNPNLALAHHWYGSMLTYEGRFREALQELDTAQRLQPSSMPILVSRAYALGLSGHRSEAIQLLQVALQPQQASTSERSTTAHHVMSSLWLVPPRDTGRFLGELEAYATLHHDEVALDHARLGQSVLKRQGDLAAWRAMLAQTERKTGDQAAYEAAGEAGLLGDLNRSLAIYSRLARERAPVMYSFPSEPKLSGVQRDARFEAVREQLGLPKPDR